MQLLSSLLSRLYSLGEAVARWTLGCFSCAVTSARGALNRDDAKHIGARVASAVISGGTVWAGLHHALSDPEVLATVVGAAIIFTGAFIDGAARCHHDGEKANASPRK